MKIEQIPLITARFNTTILFGRQIGRFPADNTSNFLAGFKNLMAVAFLSSSKIEGWNA